MAWLIAWSPIESPDAINIWLAVWVFPAFVLAVTNVLASLVLWQQMRPALYRSLHLLSLLALVTCPFAWFWLA